MLNDKKSYTTGLIVLAVVGAVAFLASSLQKDPGIPAPKPDEVLVADNAAGCVAEGADAAPPTFASAPDPRGVDSRHVFDRLVEYDRRSGRIVPGLATSWKVSADGTEYRFTLRENVVFNAVPGFQPRRLFSSEDVVFSFRRLMDATDPLHAVPATAPQDYDTVGMKDLMVSVGKDGPYTVVFSLTVKYPKFLSNLTMDFAAIQSEEYARAMAEAGTPERFAAVPVGTGPIAVAEPGTADPLTWRYAANPRYWADTIPTGAPKKLERQVPPPSTYGID